MLRGAERASLTKSCVIGKTETGRKAPRGGESPARAALALAGMAVAAAISAASAESLAQPAQNALEHKAAHYIRYRADVAALEKTPFSSAETTREAHRLLATHASDDLAAGWVAYAALVAADTPTFAEALQEEVEPKKRRRRKRGELTGQDGFMAKLSADPTYLRQLPGAQDAIERVLAMTVQDAERFTKLGEAFKEQAYAMQKTKWGKAKIKQSSKARLTDAEQFATNRPAPTPPAMTRSTDRGVTPPSLASLDGAWQPNWGQSERAGRMTEPNAQVIMDRVLNLAARYSTVGVNDRLVSAYAKNDKSNRCLSLSELTLKQCIAATRTSYEEAFCIGEHALKDISTCIGWVAGVSGES